jgi:hypothetical protein
MVEEGKETAFNVSIVPLYKAVQLTPAFVVFNMPKLCA